MPRTVIDPMSKKRVRVKAGKQMAGGPINRTRELLMLVDECLAHIDWLESLMPMETVEDQDRHVASLLKGEAIAKKLKVYADEVA